MRGGDGKRKFLRNFCLSFVSVRKCGREKENYVEENGLMSRSIEGWEEGFVVLVSTLAFIISEFS